MMTELSEQTPSLTQWKLVRSAIEHENILKNHRVTWFLATQLFLFTGFTTIFVETIKKDLAFSSLKVYAILLIVFLLGIYVCVLAWANLRAAQKMIRRLQSWWLIHCHTRNDDLKSWILSAKYFEGQTSFPPINGMFTSNLHLVFDEVQLPVALAIFWLILFYVTTIIVLQNRFNVAYLHGAVSLAAIGCVVFVLANKKIKSWLKAANTLNARELAGIITILGLKHVSSDLVSEITWILDSHPG